MERDGLRIKGLAEFAVRVQVLTDPGRLEAADTLIVAMKTPGTEAALERLRHVRLGAALSIQNGVLKDELLASAFGAPRGCWARLPIPAASCCRPVRCCSRAT